MNSALARTPLCLFTLCCLALAAVTDTPAAAAPARAVGDRVHIKPADLPPPDTSGPVSNEPVVVARPDGQPLSAPKGFRVTLFRDRLENARTLLALPDGGILVAQQKPGLLTLLRDPQGKGEATESWLWAAGFDNPFGLAFHEGFVYVADAEAVWRLPWREGSTAAAGERQRLTPPGALGGRDGHVTRSLAIAPDGAHFYVGIGSAANLAEEEEPRATIREFTIDGEPVRSVATGLRNPVGLAFRPDGNANRQDLYAVVNERDGLGDALPPDALIRIEPGGFYGWPYAYTGPNPQPGFADRRPDLVERTLPPDVLFEAHSAPIGLVFGDGLNGPARYRNGAFVALHGSSSRAEPAGYTVVFVPFEGRKPAGGYEVFVSGFRLPNEDTSPEVWGRPSGLAIARDGSLIIADSGGTVWRVAYAGSGRSGGKTGRGR